MNDLIHEPGSVQEDPRLEALLRRGLAPRDDRAAGSPESRSNERFLAEVRQRLDGGELRPLRRDSWLRAAAAMLPPVMVGGLKTPVGVKLGWKALPLALTLPLAMLVGVVAIAWFGLRSIGRPDASRVRDARSELLAHMQWSARLSWAWPVFMLVIPAITVLAPTESLGMFGAALLVYLLVVVSELSRIGRADRRSVGSACAVALLFGSLQVNSFTQAAGLGTSLSWRSAGPLVLVVGGAVCGWLAAGLPPFGRARIRIPGLGELGHGERLIALGGLLLGALPIAAVLAFAVGRPLWIHVVHGPIEGRLQRLFTEGPADLQDHYLMSVAEPVVVGGLDCDLSGFDALVAAECAENYPNRSLLAAAALAGYLPAGALEPHRDRAIERQVLSIPATAELPGFRIKTTELLALIVSRATSRAERDALAEVLARSIPDGSEYGALEDARFLLWSLQELGREDLIDAASDRLHALLAATWLPALDPDGRAGFTPGRSKDGEPLWSDESDFHAALLIGRVGAPEVIDVEAWRDRIAAHIEEADSRSTGYVSTGDFHVLAERVVLDRALGPRAADLDPWAGLPSVEFWIVLIVAGFAVVVTWRAPARNPVRLESRPGEPTVDGLAAGETR